MREREVAEFRRDEPARSSHESPAWNFGSRLDGRLVHDGIVVAVVRDDEISESKLEWT